MELVSIIIPVYNSELFLKRCLDSVINQTYKNLEIIIVEDGSSDNSLSICKKYKKLDNRIKVLLNGTNKGMAFSRNKALDNATGKYITYIDSDDYVELDYIETLYNLIKEDDYDVSICGHIDMKHEKKYILNQEKAFKLLITDENFCISCWGKLFKRYLLSGVKFYDVQCEDRAFSYKVFSKIKKAIYLNVSKYNYCIRKDSYSFMDYDIKDLDRISQTKFFTEKVTKLYPKLTNDAKIMYLNSLIAVCNKQLFSKMYKTPEIKETKKFIRNNFIIIIFTKSKLIKKMQYLLFLMNTKLYINIYRKVKKSVFT